MDNKLEAILKEVKSDKTASITTTPRSDVNEIQDSQPSGSKTNKSIGVRASNIENSYFENDDYPLRASKMKDLKHPAKPLFQNESDVDVTILSKEESEVEDYHKSNQLPPIGWVFLDKLHVLDFNRRIYTIIFL